MQIRKEGRISEYRYRFIIKISIRCIPVLYCRNSTFCARKKSSSDTVPVSVLCRYPVPVPIHAGYRYPVFPLNVAFICVLLTEINHEQHTITKSHTWPDHQSVVNHYSYTKITRGQSHSPSNSDFSGNMNFKQQWFHSILPEEIKSAGSK
jgi:hypothetical protein